MENNNSIMDNITLTTIITMISEGEQWIDTENQLKIFREQIITDIGKTIKCFFQDEQIFSLLQSDQTILINLLNNQQVLLYQYNENKLKNYLLSLGYICVEEKENEQEFLDNILSKTDILLFTNNYILHNSNILLEKILLTLEIDNMNNKQKSCMFLCYFHTLHITSFITLCQERIIIGKIEKIMLSSNKFVLIFYDVKKRFPESNQNESISYTNDFNYHYTNVISNYKNNELLDNQSKQYIIENPELFNEKVFMELKDFFNSPIGREIFFLTKISYKTSRNIPIQKILTNSFMPFITDKSSTVIIINNIDIKLGYPLESYKLPKQLFGKDVYITLPIQIDQIITLYSESIKSRLLSKLTVSKWPLSLTSETNDLDVLKFKEKLINDINRYWIILLMRMNFIYKRNKDELYLSSFPTEKNAAYGSMNLDPNHNYFIAQGKFNEMRINQQNLTAFAEIIYDIHQKCSFDQMNERKKIIFQTDNDTKFSLETKIFMQCLQLFIQSFFENYRVYLLSPKNTRPKTFDKSFIYPFTGYIHEDRFVATFKINKNIL